MVLILDSWASVSVNVKKGSNLAETLAQEVFNDQMLFLNFEH